MDVWTLGCVLAELALNEPLFNGDSEVEQLFKIFRFLGVPEDWAPVGNVGDAHVEFPRWPAISISHAAYPKSSPEFLHLCQLLIPSREATLQKLLRLSQALGLEGMRLLEATLEIDPQRRPSAESILAHPFFSDVERLPGQEWDRHGYSLSLLPKSSAEMMWELFRHCEALYAPKAGYMTRQQTINETMRSILVDWLIDVSVHFELAQETLHLAVAYLDRHLNSQL